MHYLFSIDLLEVSEGPVSNSKFNIFMSLLVSAALLWASIAQSFPIENLAPFATSDEAEIPWEDRNLSESDLHIRTNPIPTLPGEVPSNQIHFQIDIFTANADDPSNLDRITAEVGKIVDTETSRNPHLCPKLFVLGYNPNANLRTPQSEVSKDSSATQTVSDAARKAEKARINFAVIRGIASGAAVYLATYISFGVHFSEPHALAAASLGAVASGVLQYLAGYPWYKKFFAPGKNVLPRSKYDLTQLAKNFGLYAAYLSVVRSPFFVQNIQNLDAGGSVFSSFLSWQAGVWQASAGATWAALPWANALIEKFQRDIAKAGDNLDQKAQINKNFNRNFLFLALFLLGTAVAAAKVPGLIWYVQIPFGAVGIVVWKWSKISDFLISKGFVNTETGALDLLRPFRKKKTKSNPCSLLLLPLLPPKE